MNRHVNEGRAKTEPQARPSGPSHTQRALEVASPRAVTRLLDLGFLHQDLWLSRGRNLGKWAQKARQSALRHMASSSASLIRVKPPCYIRAMPLTLPRASLRPWRWPASHDDKSVRDLQPARKDRSRLWFAHLRTNSAPRLETIETEAGAFPAATARRRAAS